MHTLPRRAGRVLVAAAATAGLLAATGPARAQVQGQGQGQAQGRTQKGRAVSTWQNRSGLDPWGNGSAFGVPTYRPPSYLGTLPNGTPVINPWNQPTATPPVPVLQALFAYQYTLLNAAAIWNPSLYQYYATGSAAGWMQPGGFGPGIQPVPPANAGLQPGLTFRPGVQAEPGGFARLGPDLAVNRVTGTVLQPYAGVAYTNEGAFFRVAGTGTFTPWGAYMPGSGVYLNPFTGTAYNPQTGLILRP